MSGYFDIEWKKSSYSLNGECVEVSKYGGKVLVRNSNDADLVTLTFRTEEWDTFVRGVKAGEFG